MIGPATAVEMLPEAPMMASSSAPPAGNRSEVMPSIVGHQNAVPTASSVAAFRALRDYPWPSPQLSPRGRGSNRSGVFTACQRSAPT